MLLHVLSAAGCLWLLNHPAYAVSKQLCVLHALGGAALLVLVDPGLSIGMQLGALLVLGTAGLVGSMQECVLLVLGAAGVGGSQQLCLLLVLHTANVVLCAVCADI
jgi:hypothetical protein